MDIAVKMFSYIFREAIWQITYFKEKINALPTINA